MVTKDEERKALAKIKKIMTELTNNGTEETYIGFAFREVIEDAEFNIANDSAVSKADSAEFWRIDSEEQQRRVGELEKKNEVLQTAIDTLTEKQFTTEECRKIVDTIQHCKVAIRQFDNGFKNDIVENIDKMDSEPFIRARANHLEMVEILTELDEMREILRNRQ